MDMILNVLMVIALLVAYPIPLAVAIKRDHFDVDNIVALNLMFGWTGIVWLICLVWACWPVEPVKKEG